MRRRWCRTLPESTLNPGTKARCSPANAGRRPTTRLPESSERGTTRICRGTSRQSGPRAGHARSDDRPLPFRHPTKSSLSEQRDAFGPRKDSGRAKRQSYRETESTNPAKYPDLLFRPYQNTLNQQVVSNERLAVVISTPTVELNVTTNLPPRLLVKIKHFQRLDSLPLLVIVVLPSSRYSKLILDRTDRMV